MKKGFTLAEVLITLAIIGVVAALTIPTVIHKYQQKAQYTAFMKMYNTLTNTLQLAQAEFGTPNTWNYDYHDNAQVIQAIRTYIYSYLKISKICEDNDISNCFPTYQIKYLNGSVWANSNERFYGNGMTVILEDGSIVETFPIEHEAIMFLFDTNGVKGPNTFGRDFFALNYIQDANGKWGFNFSDSDANESACDPSSNSDAGVGGGCAARLIKEGKMNY